jgi:hypothetical protein
MPGREPKRLEEEEEDDDEEEEEEKKRDGQPDKGKEDIPLRLEADELID